MAVEAGRRLVELPRPKKNSDRIRRDNQPNNRRDAEFKPDGLGADVEADVFKVIGVNARQGTFLGLFSWDSMVAMPLAAFNKYFSLKNELDARGENQGQSDVRVKVKDKTKLAEAKDELTGMMRRVRGLPPE